MSDYPSSTSPPQAVPNQPTSPTAFARAHSRHYSLAHIKRTNSDDTLPGLTHARSLLLEHISISLLLAAEASFEATCAQRGTPAHHIYQVCACHGCAGALCEGVCITPVFFVELVSSSSDMKPALLMPWPPPARYLRIASARSTLSPCVSQ